MLDTQDTIAAIASPPGPTIRGLVRLSGPDSLAIVDRLSAAENKAVRSNRPELIPQSIRIEGRTLPASIGRWPGPRTYTGQPMAEVHTVGSPPLLQQVLITCLQGGARLAEPGEFTLRAFLAGRIDLTQAEAVLGVIESRTPAQLDQALQQLAGGLAGPIDRLREQVLDTLAHLEAGLDFVDEPDVDPIGRQALADSMAQAADEIAALAARLKGRDRPVAAPKVVLVGPPNAGKSHLFNALIGNEHALVSPIAGTTRDYLAAPCDCDGLSIELIDTAGIEQTAEPIESEAQALRDAQSAGADLLLDCRSADAPAVVELPTDRPQVVVWTKADQFPAPPETIATSAASGLGLDTLKRVIVETIGRYGSEEDSTGLTSARCRDSLMRSADALRQASTTIVLGGGDELVAIDLRDVVDELGQVLGKQIDDAVLDRIFQRFCIGK